MQRVTKAEKTQFRQLVKVERFKDAGVIRLDFRQPLPGTALFDARAARIMAAILNEEALALERYKDGNQAEMPAVPSGL